MSAVQKIDPIEDSTDTLVVNSHTAGAWLGEICNDAVHKKKIKTEMLLATQRLIIQNELMMRGDIKRLLSKIASLNAEIAELKMGRKSRIGRFLHWLMLKFE
jgi:hypothetical protein